jgi:hypothetical protein
MIVICIAIQEFSWLQSLPYFINSNDLGTLFVHAGFQSHLKITEQDPWAMMTMRSVLPDGRVSTRCFQKHPWAGRWRGPMTVLFGHDAARGVQEYECAVGLDSGCVYGGRLSAYELPEKKFYSVPARTAYLDFGTSRSHKMYAYSGAVESGDEDLDLMADDDQRVEHDDKQ